MAFCRALHLLRILPIIELTDLSPASGKRPHPGSVGQWRQASRQKEAAQALNLSGFFDNVFLFQL
jgi:hypothetical protein